MTELRSYLDYNASAPLLDEARTAMVDALGLAGNPSSVHAEGRAARAVIDRARRDVAALVGARPADIVFTSGATEAAATLLTPRYRRGRTPQSVSRLLVGATEHPCVLAGGGFPADRLAVLPVTADGLLDLAALRASLDAHDPDEGLPLVAVQLANNETGVIQPVSEIARITKERGGLLVVDAVQAAGRIPLDIDETCADFLILSSHKIGGPKGAGAIVARSDAIMPEPLIRGGGQEKGHRAGTEALPAIAGFGAAARFAITDVGHAGRLARLRDMAEARVRALAPDAVIHGEGAPRLPNTLFFSVPGMKAETAQIAFDLAGVALSAGSACSSGKVGPSRVLAAMGQDGGPGALRVSVGHGTSEDDIERFAAALAALVGRRSRTSGVHAA
jgi:cysteine desulfurase